MAACSHLNQVRLVEPPGTIVGCSECLRIGSGWVHLQMCQSCGTIRCCDSSHHKHASGHAAEEGHPIVRSVEPGEDWSWCYVDQLMFQLTAE